MYAVCLDKDLYCMEEDGVMATKVSYYEYQY